MGDDDLGFEAAIISLPDETLNLLLADVGQLLDLLIEEVTRDTDPALMGTCFPD